MFRTRAQTGLMLPVRRTPPGQYTGNPQAPPRAKTKPWFRCHLISFRRFSRQKAFRPIAHLSGPHLTRSLPRLFLHRSRPRSSAKAPVGGLKPPPARRLRRSRKLLHLLIQHRRPGTPSPTPAHVHKVFSQRSMWWFAATLRKGGCEGPNLHLLHSTTSRSSTYIEPLSVLVAHVASQTLCPIAGL